MENSGVQARANGSGQCVGSFDSSAGATVIITKEDIDGSTVQDGEHTEEEPPAIDIIISNVVCCFSVRAHINLRKVACESSHVIYKKELGMVSMKIRKPSATASIWSSGKVTCTGSTSDAEALTSARRISRKLQRVGFNTKVANFRIVNVLGSVSMPWAINVIAFSSQYPKEASYEPELHPGVTFKLKQPKATLKIFSTGSITVTAPCIANVQSAIEHIFPLVHEHRREKHVVTQGESLAVTQYLQGGSTRVRPANRAPGRSVPVAKRRRRDSAADTDTDSGDAQSSDDDYL